MSGLLDKAKEKLGKSGGSGHEGGGGEQSGVEKAASKQMNTQIDNATDKAGMGDKYDQQISQFADKQMNNQIPGGAGSK